MPDFSCQVPVNPALVATITSPSGFLVALSKRFCANSSFVTWDNSLSTTMSGRAPTTGNVGRDDRAFAARRLAQKGPRLDLHARGQPFVEVEDVGCSLFQLRGLGRGLLPQPACLV